MKGHVRRRGEQSWELKFDLGRDPVTGRRRVRYQSFKGTKRKAEAELAKLLVQADGGNLVDASKETVAEFLDRWLRDWATINTSPKTTERYTGLIDHQIKPHIGSTRLQKLRPFDLVELYAKLLREGRAIGARHGAGNSGLAARTVGHVHRVLRRALGHATLWGVIQANAAADVKPPRVEAEEVEILRESEVKQLLNNLHGRSLYMIALAGLGTGMRRGEMLALRRQDVDLVAGTVRIERSLEHTRAGGLRFKSPKTKRGRRTISIAPSLVTEMRAHFKAQQERWLALGRGKVSDDTLVFATWQGEPRTPNALSKDWSETMDALGLSVTLHGLRHTHASQLIAGGMDVVALSARLGHASPAITLAVYGHHYKVRDDRAVEIMEAAFSRSRTE